MTNNIFEQIKKVNEHGQEFWYARELAKVLDYTDYGNFENVIEKAMISCQKSGQNTKDHFGDATEMVGIGSRAERAFSSFMLSRYASYLIAQNGDPRKVEIAKAQTYFAIQTRRQEEQELRIEDNKRVMLRGEMKEHNKKLASAAKSAGVTNYANFQDAGYMGLYGGLRQKDIHQKKLKEKESILDRMGSEELKRENIRGQQSASNAHNQVGKKVRQTIKELGGVMPEKLLTPENIRGSKKRIKQPTKKSLRK